MNFDLCCVTIVSSSCLLWSVCLAAIMERIEKERRASVTDNVPSDHGADREGAERVGHRQRALGTVLAPGEGEDVRTALALAVDVHPADLIDQWVDQRPDLVRVGAEDADLLAVLGGDDVFQRRLDILERHDRHDRAELLLPVKLHAFLHREHDRRIEQRLGGSAAALVDDLGALGLGILDRLGHEP
ncbi:MAG: hypothetical protein K0S21_3684, partial [Rhizobiaceae bacterium]|nr:hypothetical protein [Rhizobiaceae bacterium]